MEIAELNSIDWSAPWLAPSAKLGRAISTACCWRTELNRFAAERRLCNFGGQSIVFADGDVAGDEPYEAHIARTGQIPTRASLHDLFNALAWLQYPQSKAQLNRLQSSVIAREGVRPVRGPVRDAATLIDENAVLLVTLRADVIEALRRHDWSRIFAQQRAAWSAEISVLPFGHALLEKLIRPYEAITAHALHVALAPDASSVKVDRCLAAMLGADLSPRCLMPLPVLGIPGWWVQNEERDFYADPAVFRPANMRGAKHDGEAIE